MSKIERYQQIKILSKLLLNISKLDISSHDYINQVLEVLTHYFQADRCLWHHTKKRFDFLDLTEYSIEELKRIKVVNLNSKYGVEALLIINPKIDYELESFLLDSITDILENISKSDFFVSDLKTEMFTDSLTGVSNYDAFQNSVLTRKTFNKVCICFIDTNNLGVINNLYGHDAGDNMLIKVAQTLKEYFRMGDIYRKGGDEFIIVCEGMKESEFNKRLEKVKTELALFDYSISSGLVYRDYATDAVPLLKLADTLMYMEKDRFRASHPSKYSAVHQKK